MAFYQCHFIRDPGQCWQIRRNIEAKTFCLNVLKTILSWGLGLSTQYPGYSHHNTRYVTDAFRARVG